MSGGVHRDPAVFLRGIGSPDHVTAMLQITGMLRMAKGPEP